MFRKIINTILVVLLFAGTGWLGWKYFNKVSHPEKNVLDCVPSTAAAILTIQQPLSFWKKLSTGNILWLELQNAGIFRSVKEAGKRFDSLSVHNKEFYAFISGKEIAFSIHPSGSGTTDFLFAIEQGIYREEKIKELLKTAFLMNNEPEDRLFKTDHIFTLKNKNGEDWFMLIKNGFVTLSSSGSFSESVAIHLEENKSLRKNQSWEKVGSSMTERTELQLFINHQHLGGLLQNWISPEMENLLRRTDPYGWFSGLDLNITTSAISAIGFTSSSDSLSHFLSIFSNHQPQSFTASRILPENTSAFLWLGINDGKSFASSIEKWHDRNKKGDAYREKINQFNSECDCDIRHSLLSWMGNEMVLFSTEKNRSDTMENIFLAVRLNELEDAVSLLNELALKLDSSFRVTDDKYTYSIKGGAVFSILFGEIFAQLNNPKYIQIEDYILFYNSKMGFNDYIRDIAAERTLGKNITYHNFVSEHLSDKANVTVYANPSRLKQILHSVTDPEKTSVIDRHEELIKKFNAFAWQMSNSSNGLFYNNLYLKYNADGKSDYKTIWELALDTTIRTDPVFISNHITSTKDIFVQDEDYQIYLISSRGQVIWKKQLEESVTGEVQQIDLYKNGKLQLLFCTTDQLHVIDLKGNYVDGYPVKLSSTATTGPVAFDYENDGNYRILVGAGKTVFNFEKNGKPVTGWEFEGTFSDVIQPPDFFRCENKDYIFIADRSGKMYVVDRKGKTRYEVNSTMNNRSVNPVYLDPGRTIENTKVIYSDSSGIIHKIYFNGIHDSIFTGYHSASHRFKMLKLNQDELEDFILLDSSSVMLYTATGKEISRYRFDAPPRPEIYTAKMRDGTVWIGILIPGTGEIYVLNNVAEIHPRFPVQGMTGFRIADSNGDGTLELVAGNGGRRIMCYSFR